MMHPQSHFCFHFLLVLSVLNGITPRLEFKNLICTSMNKDFCDFDYCILKSVNRTYKYASLKLIVYERPVTNIMVNFAVYKRANGYKPFLYNISLDGCKFMKNQKSNPITQYMFGFIKDVTNLNHTCPYNEDILMEKLTVEFVNHRITDLLPVPEGTYMVKSVWTLNKKSTVIFEMYGTIF